VRRLSIALLLLGALITGISLYHYRESLPIDQLQQIATPLLEPLTPLFDKLTPLWQTIKENPLSHAVTSLGTTATISIIGKYLVDYALRKKDEAHAIITNEKDKLLANHTGEITTLTDANKLLTDQTENARLKQEKAELELAKAKTELTEKNDEIHKVIAERNLAQRALADVEKLKEEIKEEGRKH